MSDWRPEDVAGEVMGAYGHVTNLVTRVHRAQGRLMLAFHEVERLEKAGQDCRRLRGVLVEAADSLGLPPETWEVAT